MIAPITPITLGAMLATSAAFCPKPDSVSTTWP